MKERGQLGASLEIQGGDGNTGGVRERRTHSSDCSGGVLPVLLPGANHGGSGKPSQNPLNLFCGLKVLRHGAAYGQLILNRRKPGRTEWAPVRRPPLSSKDHLQETRFWCFPQNENRTVNPPVSSATLFFLSLEESSREIAARVPRRSTISDSTYGPYSRVSGFHRDPWPAPKAGSKTPILFSSGTHILSLTL